MVLAAHGLMALAAHGLMVFAAQGFRVLATQGLRVFAAHGLMVLAAQGLMVFAAQGLIVRAAQGLIVLAAQGLIVRAAHGLMVLAAQGFTARSAAAPGPVGEGTELTTRTTVNPPTVSNKIGRTIFLNMDFLPPKLTFPEYLSPMPAVERRRYETKHPARLCLHAAPWESLPARDVPPRSFQHDDLHRALPA